MIGRVPGRGPSIRRWWARRGSKALALLLPALGSMASPAGCAEPEKVGKVELSADFRLRFEADRDSRRADGVEREDRDRVRIRARLAVRFAASENLELGARLRSGSDDSQQSPHVTLLDLDGNDTGDADFPLDQWYVRAKRDRLSGWAGRNSFPFWKQNEFFWDDDVTPAGLAGAYSGPAGEDGKLTLHLAYLSLPVGMRHFAGELAGGQLVYSRSRNWPFTLAAGFFDFDPSPADPDAARLLSGNGSRPYRILVANAQVALEAGERPLVFGLDLLHNAESYSATDPDPFTAANSDQTDGLVLSARWGNSSVKGDWLIGYSYARIETFAVNSSYAGDDWARWGSAVQSRLSDMEGHELRYARALGGGMNLVARLFLVEAITTAEDGNRFRLDLNYAL